MSDQEFIEAVKTRLKEKGWCQGKLGTFEGPNCVLGAAGFVEHGADLRMDDEGVIPQGLGDQDFNENSWTYGEVPGFIRLTTALGFSEGEIGKIINLNDEGPAFWPTDDEKEKKKAFKAFLDRLDARLMATV